MKKIIIGVLVIIEIFSLYMMYQSNENKNLNEVNIKDNKINKNTFAIYWDENSTGEYTEYEEDGWPSDGYVLDLSNTKCMSEKGSELDNNIIKYNSSNNSLTLTSKNTAYCTLYFYLPENREYEYTGNYQIFKAPKEGNYKIKLWGASGGGAYYDYGNSLVSEAGYERVGEYIKGGNGAYTSGKIKLSKNEKLYIYVGEMGKDYSSVTYLIRPAGGYNGGGYGGYAYQIAAGGGGATDVRLDISSSGNWNDFESLKSRIMVAAGGGGTSNFHNAVTGGYGGSLIGGSGILNENSVEHQLATGGTQISGGIRGAYYNAETDPTDGKFGQGGDSQNGHGGGGGSGYYGGGGGSYIDDGVSSGAGGSSYISGHEGCVAIKKESTEENVQPKAGCTDGTKDINCSYHYSGKYFTDTQMIAGNSQMPTHSGDGNMTGNEGNGYAKITFVN